MKTPEEIKKIATSTLEEEAQAIINASKQISADFCNVVELLYNSKGRVVVTGIGKSAIVANKIVATLNSTGTPSIFMHAADAVHGDLGIMQNNDVVVCISKSGNTPEIKVLVPLLKASKNKLVAIVGNKDSYLAQQADYIIDSTVDKEACPNNLAPTSSTTVQMALGDALAVSLLEMREFTAEDFAKYHPGGSLGKRLYLRISDVFHSDMPPAVDLYSNVKDVIVEISSKRLGATAVLDKEKLVGVITDGDIRRMLEKHSDLSKITAKDIMNDSPKTVKEDALATEAVKLMREYSISQLIVADSSSNYFGMVHMHDLMKEGII